MKENNKSLNFMKINYWLKSLISHITINNTTFSTHSVTNVKYKCRCLFLNSLSKFWCIGIQKESDTPPRKQVVITGRH